VAGADLVLIIVPTHAHEEVARLLAPHIEPEQIVMAAPGHTLLLIPRTLRAAGGRLGVYCDSSSLPFICRKSTPRRINITRVAQRLYFAAFPGTHIEAVSQHVRHVFPQDALKSALSWILNNLHYVL
jgi:opine dehydrogenase